MGIKVAIIGKRAASVAVSTALGLLVAATAAADRARIHLRPADQNAARRMVLQRSDLASDARWTGGPVKPSPPTPISCANFDPKQSDLVVTGDAESVFKHVPYEFDSEAQVLETARMVRLDWQRTIENPALVSCLRQKLAQSLVSGQTLVSFERIAFRPLGTYTAAYRALVDTKTTRATVRMMIDFVVFGTGRYELNLTTTAPYNAVTTVAAAERQLATAMLARAQPGSA